MRRGKKTIVKMYTPTPTVDYQNAVAAHVMYEMDSADDILDEECVMFTHFYVHTKHKHDLDNFLKAMMDALNEVIYTDDHLVKNVFASCTYNKENSRSIVAFVTKKDFDKQPAEYYQDWLDILQLEDLH